MMHNLQAFQCIGRECSPAAIFRAVRIFEFSLRGPKK